MVRATVPVPHTEAAMADAETQKAEWVSRVLGIDVPGTESATAADPASRWRDALLVWRGAQSAATTQINSLRAAMLATGHDMLREIATSHLDHVIGGETDALRAVLSDIGGGEGGKLDNGRAKALGAVRTFRTHLAGDIRVAACDENELGVSVSLRATLDPALAAMEAALRT
jgi:hypothetical protein